MKSRRSKKPVSPNGNSSEITLAIPSKGSLHEGTLAFLRSAGLGISYGNERQYTARLTGIDGVRVLLQRAGEIYDKVAEGAADAGITGEDLFRERFDPSDGLMLVRGLAYGRARLVVAVPSSWIDVTSMEELADLALSFRLRHLRNLRVATKFANLTRAFFSEHRIADYSVVQSLGATESAPASGAADILVDLTSSGKTLAENHLKPLQDGTVLSSQASLIASKRIADWGAEKSGRISVLMDLFDSHLRASETYHLEAIVRRSRLTTLTGSARPWSLLYSVSTDPPVSKRVQEPHVLVRISCPSAHLYDLIQSLRGSGGTEVTVTRPEYIFQARSESFEAMTQLIEKGEDG